MKLDGRDEGGEYSLETSCELRSDCTWKYKNGSEEGDSGGKYEWDNDRSSKLVKKKGN